MINNKENRFSTCLQLAQYLGVHERIIASWLKNYTENGVVQMFKNQPKPQESKYIRKEIHKGLASKVTNIHNPYLGYWAAQNGVNASMA